MAAVPTMLKTSFGFTPPRPRYDAECYSGFPGLLTRRLTRYQGIYHFSTAPSVPGAHELDDSVALSWFSVVFPHSSFCSPCLLSVRRFAYLPTYQFTSLILLSVSASGSNERCVFNAGYQTAVGPIRIYWALLHPAFSLDASHTFFTRPRQVISSLSIWPRSCHTKSNEYTSC